MPLPSLRLAHWFLDDFFAIAASFAGLAPADSLILIVAAVWYLAVGIAVGPILTRLTWIHFRIGWAIVRKAIRGATRDGPAAWKPARWLVRTLEADGLAADGVTVLPAYTYRAPEIGRCRGGFPVLTPHGLLFATRVLFRPRLLRFDNTRLARLGLATSATTRTVTVVDRTQSGALREVVFYLFPAYADEVLPGLERGAAAARLVRVRPNSESARRGLPGWAQRGQSVNSRPRFGIAGG